MLLQSTLVHQEEVVAKTPFGLSLSARSLLLLWPLCGRSLWPARLCICRNSLHELRVQLAVSIDLVCLVNTGPGCERCSRRRRPHEPEGAVGSFLQHSLPRRHRSQYVRSGVTAIVQLSLQASEQPS